MKNRNFTGFATIFLVIGVIVILIAGTLIIRHGKFFERISERTGEKEKTESVEEGIVPKDESQKEEFKEGVLTAPEQITINAESKSPAKLLSGFLHGITYDRSKNYSKTVDLISKLEPKFWRLSNEDNNVYGFVNDEAKFPSLFGTKITFVIQDVFILKYGFPVNVNAGCSAEQTGCFQSFGALRSSWNSLVDEIMRQLSSRNLTVHYYDVFNEPNWGWNGVKPQELLELFKDAHNIIRSYKPQAKIVAPSYAFYDWKILELFLSYASSNNLRIDALSWHEFGLPEEVVAHTAEVRKNFSGEIHINEYANADSHLIPGEQVGWFYYFEKAGVDQAHRACWDVVRGPGQWSTCWAGFNGVLSKDNETPLHLYWVFKFYRDMQDERISSESNRPHTVALASWHDSTQEIKVLLGRYAYRGAASDVTITINSYPYSAQKVSAEIWRIPNNQNKAVALKAPIAVKSQTLEIKNKTLKISFGDIQDGEVYFVILKP